MHDEITIRLNGQVVEDGRIYVTSPDLKGFHFLLEKGDDPVATMKPTLEIYLKLMLKAELKDVKPLVGLQEYKAQKLNIRNALNFFPRTIMAEMAEAG